MKLYWLPYVHCLGTFRVSITLMFFGGQAVIKYPWHFTGLVCYLRQLVQIVLGIFQLYTSLINEMNNPI